MLYLIDKPLADLGLRAASEDPDARVALLQDGVLLDPNLDVPTFAVQRDAAVRGIDLPEAVEPVSYDRLVKLMFEHEVASFI
jgi:tRNA 2-thiouridine synthesizing protein B